MSDIEKDPLAPDIRELLDKAKQAPAGEPVSPDLKERLWSRLEDSIEGPINSADNTEGVAEGASTTGTGATQASVGASASTTTASAAGITSSTVFWAIASLTVAGAIATAVWIAPASDEATRPVETTTSRIEADPAEEVSQSARDQEEPKTFASEWSDKRGEISPAHREETAPTVEESPPEEEPEVTEPTGDTDRDDEPPAQIEDPPADSSPPTAPQAVPAPPPGDLAEEQRVLREARSALADGHPTDALKVVEVHAERFPSGVLSEEREALRLRAIHQDGRIDELRRAADAFLETYPDSIFRDLAMELRSASAPEPQ